VLHRHRFRLRYFSQAAGKAASGDGAPPPKVEQETDVSLLQWSIRSNFPRKAASPCKLRRSRHRRRQPDVSRTVPVISLASAAC